MSIDLLDDPLDTIGALTLGIAALKTLGEHMAKPGRQRDQFALAAVMLKDLQCREIRTKVRSEIAALNNALREGTISNETH